MSVNFVTAVSVKSFDIPDKKRCPDKAEFDLVTVNDYSVARLILNPGWRWSESSKPFEKTDFCQHNHLGFCVSGVLEVETADGVRSIIRANDTYTLPPGHDEWVWDPSRSSPWSSWAPPPSAGRPATVSTPGSNAPHLAG